MIMSSSSASTPTYANTASSSTSSSSSSDSSPSTFYKNLFYILIGILVAFGLVSFISLLRVRRRRRAILLEAERLGVVVPGMPGYISMGDRQMMGLSKTKVKQPPDWWEIRSSKDPDGHVDLPGPRLLGRLGGIGGGLKEYASRASLTVPTFSRKSSWESLTGKHRDAFQPLAMIPPVAARPEVLPIPHSPISFFPTHLAYRAESILPPPLRFEHLNGSNLEKLDPLIGQDVEVLSVIRMPQPPRGQGYQLEEGEEIIQEWGGVEIGIASIKVTGLALARGTRSGTCTPRSRRSVRGFL